MTPRIDRLAPAAQAHQREQQRLYQRAWCARARVERETVKALMESHGWRYSRWLTAWVPDRRTK